MSLNYLWAAFSTFGKSIQTKQICDSVANVYLLFQNDSHGITFFCMFEWYRTVIPLKLSIIIIIINK